MTEAINIEKPANNVYQPQEIIEKSPDNALQESENPTIISGRKPPTYIREKWKYVKFKRAIKKHGYTTARLMAKSLGVHYDTILKWTNTPQVQEALRMDLHNYTSKISKSKDWKAQAYLLDKVLEQQDKENPTIDLKQMIVINT